MKTLFTLLSVAALLLIIKPQATFAQRGGEHAEPAPYSLVDVTFNPSGYPGGTVGDLKFLENNGPGLTGSFFSLGLSAGENAQINIADIFPSWPLGIGPYNDRTRAVVFSGNCTGTYTFYDDPNGSTSDDYCTITITSNPPTGKSYFIWTLEDSYWSPTSGLSIIYHHVSGLDNKVSSVNVVKN